LSEESLLNRVNGLFHEVELLKLGLKEVNARLESACDLFRLDLVAEEDRIRHQADGDEDLVG